MILKIMSPGRKRPKTKISVTQRIRLQTYDDYQWEYILFKRLERPNALEEMPLATFFARRAEVCIRSSFYSFVRTGQRAF